MADLTREKHVLLSFVQFKREITAERIRGQDCSFASLCAKPSRARVACHAAAPVGGSNAVFRKTPQR